MPEQGEVVYRGIEDGQERIVLRYQKMGAPEGELAPPASGEGWRLLKYVEQTELGRAEGTWVRDRGRVPIQEG